MTKHTTHFDMLQIVSQNVTKNALERHSLIHPVVVLEDLLAVESCKALSAPLGELDQPCGAHAAPVVLQPVVGVTGEQVVFRAIYTEINAKLQAEALRLGQGEVAFLNAEEAANATATNNAVLSRAWELWKQRTLRPRAEHSSVP